MATKEQMKLEFQFFGEVWTFYKKYYDTRFWTDDVWSQIINDGNALISKFNHPLCRDLVGVVISDLERKSNGVV